MMSNNKLIFVPSDPSFRLVVTYLMAFQGFVSAALLYNSEGVPERPSPEDVNLFDAAVCQRRLNFRPDNLVRSMVNNRWPEVVEFDVVEIARRSKNSSPQWGVLEVFLFGLGQSLIGNFFEEQRARIEEEYGSLNAWPAVWNFARVIRNTMSHGGRMAIRDKSQVSWKGLSYSSADNGRAIINVDIFPGDLFFLVKEMEASLPSRSF